MTTNIKCSDRVKFANKGNSIPLLLIIAIFSMGFFACKSNDKAATAQVTQNTAYDSLKAVHDSVVNQYNAANLQVDDLTTKASNLDSAVRKKDAEIAKLKKEVAQLSSKNKTLNGKLKNNDKFMASIKDELSQKEKEYAERLGILQGDKESLLKQLADLLTKYTALKDLGSVLHASNISLEPIHLKRNGTKEKKTKRARKMNILRIHFDIDENRIADDGTKKLYLVINGPDGQLLTGSNDQTTTFTSYKGETVKFSVEKDIMLHQNEPVKDVTADWKQEGEHEKGTYNIAIFNGGYKIGSGSVVMK